VKPKWFASLLSECIGFKRLHWQNMFVSHRHGTYDFSRWFTYLRQEVIGLMSGPLIVRARIKIDTELYKFVLNTSKIAFFKQNLFFFADFSWKFVTWFLSGSSSFSWHDLAGLGDNQGCGVAIPVIRFRLRFLAISIIRLRLQLRLRLRTDSDLQLY